MTDEVESRLGDLRKTGRKLREAWKRAAADPVPVDTYPANREEAYIVQDAFAEGLEDEVAGWKVGATSPLMREIDGHDDIIPGRLFNSRTWRASSCEIPIKLFPNSRIEAEFGFELLRDIKPEAECLAGDDVRDALLLRPSIEIIGLRHAPPTAASASARSLLVVADNGSACGCIAGDPVENWRNLDLKNMVVGLSVDGGENAENFLGDHRADPVEVVAELANHLRGRGFGLRKGDIVLTGAAAIPQPIRAGSKVEIRFPGAGTLRLNCV